MVNLIHVLNSEHVEQELTMTPAEQNRFDTLYNRHLRALKLRGLSDKTIDVYARAVRRLTTHYQCCPDQLTIEQLEAYFAELVVSHSWSTVKVDRSGTAPANPTLPPSLAVVTAYSSSGSRSSSVIGPGLRSSRHPKSSHSPISSHPTKSNASSVPHANCVTASSC